MTTELSAFVVANAGSLTAMSAALSILGLVGLAIFATDDRREMLVREEEQDGF